MVDRFIWYVGVQLGTYPSEIVNIPNNIKQHDLMEENSAMTEQVL